MENIDNYFLNINWTDLEDFAESVGYFCLYNDKFYFKISSEEKIPEIYSRGFGGMPGVQPDRIYVSNNEMFNILKKRLGMREGEKEKIEIMKELLGNKIDGDNLLDNKRDRISFTPMTEEEVLKCKIEIDELEDSKEEQKNVESR